MPPSLSPVAAEQTIRVMVVDDSAVIRGLLSRVLKAAPDVEIVASVPDGRAAVSAIHRTSVDVIILDVDMPVMDGLTAIPLLVKAAPGVKIVIASTHTDRNARITLDALSAGAADYILKPSAAREMLGQATFNRELLEKIRLLGRKTGGTATNRAPAGMQALAPGSPEQLQLRPGPALPPQIIAFGSSTGGPQALFHVLRDMAPGARIPILVAQHMPATFTSILATQIARQCGVVAMEAVDGSALDAGCIYVAPGNFHMTVAKTRTIRLNQDPPENYCRPSVDPLLRSLAACYGDRALVVILTGMGRDGLSGSKAVVEAGGAVFAQDEATSVVWGMPGAVAAAGLCSAVLPLAEIGPRLRPYALKA
jgi:two-component system, chemotaxis family, protein-glutamate methylesterase/glutaminase